jgi:hypothetical protein
LLDPTPFEDLFKTDRKIREQIFAGHVDILQALRESNALEIRRITEDYILIWCRILQKHAAISMPAFISGAIKKRWRDEN